MDFDGKFSYSPIVFVEGLAGKMVVYLKVVCRTQTTADKLDLPARLLNAQGVEVWRGMQTEVKTNFRLFRCSKNEWQILILTQTINHSFFDT